MHIVTKTYQDLPAAHRQPNHTGHCRLIHGHNWTFEVTFGATKLDACDFIIDLGDLKYLKNWFMECFDHTLLLNLDDPLLKSDLGQVILDLQNTASIRLVPNCGMEGLANFVAETVQEHIDEGLIKGKDRGLIVLMVVCQEDSKNKAAWIRPGLDLSKNAILV